jgi:hypothetical protein
MWVRGLEDMGPQPVLALEDIDDLKLPELPAELPIRMRGAARAWRRAAESSDSLETIVALWEAIEFYAADTKMEKAFTSSELKAVRSKALETIGDGEKRDRIEQVVGMLNQPSLMMKLRRTLENDGVPYTVHEFQFLRDIRDKRNDMVHGNSTEAPSEAGVKYAMAIVNRMLVYRVARLNRTSSTTRSLSTAESVLERFKARSRG